MGRVDEVLAVILGGAGEAANAIVETKLAMRNAQSKQEMDILDKYLTNKQLEYNKLATETRDRVSGRTAQTAKDRLDWEKGEADRAQKAHETRLQGVQGRIDRKQKELDSLLGQENPDQEAIKRAREQIEELEDFYEALAVDPKAAFKDYRSKEKTGEGVPTKIQQAQAARDAILETITDDMTEEQKAAVREQALDAYLKGLGALVDDSDTEKTAREEATQAAEKAEAEIAEFNKRGLLTEDQSKKLMQLSSGTLRSSTATEFRRAGVALRAMQSAKGKHGEGVNGKVAELAVLYSLIRAVDPNSVVREGEVNIFGRGRSFGEYLGEKLKRIEEGTILTDQEVREIYQLGERLKSVYAANLSRYTESLAEQWKGQGLYRLKDKDENIIAGTDPAELLKHLSFDDIDLADLSGLKREESTRTEEEKKAETEATIDTILDEKGTDTTPETQVELPDTLIAELQKAAEAGESEGSVEAGLKTAGYPPDMIKAALKRYATMRKSEGE